MKVSCIYFCLLFLSFFFPVQSQPTAFRFQHINATQGLSHGFTRKVLRDSKGYMWFGTANGLNKFDGYNMKVYKYNADDEHSLSSSDILSMFEDSNQNLWIGTSAGVNLYNRDLDNFTHFPELKECFVNSIAEDHSKVVWVSGRTALYHYRKDLQKFEKFELPGADLNIISIYEDSDRTFWLGMLDHLATLNRKTHQLVLLDSFNIRNVSCIYEDHRKNIWIGSKGLGLLKIDKRTSVRKHFRKELGMVNGVACDVVLALHEDRNDYLWIGTENGGLVIYGFEENDFTHQRHNPSDPESLCFNSIYSIASDKNKNMWLGTFTGVELLKSNKFDHVRPDFFNNQGLSSNYILSFFEDHLGNIWIGTDGDGLEMFNRKTNVYTHFKHSEKNPSSLSTNAVTYVYEDRQNNLWLGTWAGGLDLFDRAASKFIHFKPDRSNGHTIQNENIIHIYEDRRSNLWIGTGSGIDLLDRKTLTFTHYNFPNTIMSSFPGDILEDRYGNLWIGAYDGLCIFDRQTKKIITFRHRENDSTSISNNVVHTLFEDSKGKLWIGTLGGLNRFDHQSRSFKSYHEKDGLPSDAVYGILEDRKGFLWISTSNGISKFDPERQTFKNYNVDDGLQGNEFKSNAFCKLKSGEMLFGGDNGFNIFNPEQIQDNFIVPPVVLTDFKIFNRSVSIGARDSPLQKHISETNDVVLSYKSSVISFDFAAISFASPENNQYAYKLEGLEENWNYVGGKREATYTSLDAGTYFFKVIASNNDGIWNKQGTTLKITITPPFWETWWFRGTAFFLVVILINIFIRLRINRYKRQKKILEKIVEKKTGEISRKNKFLEEANVALSRQKEEILEQKEAILQMSVKVKEADDRKLTFFTNISHEFRTPLTLILGPTRNLIAKLSEPAVTEDLNIIYKNAHRLLFLVNELMDFHKLDNNQMKLQVSRGDIIQFFSEVVYAFEELAAQKEIALSFLTGVEKYETWFDVQKLEIILYNLISNAFKFTKEGGRIRLKLCVKEEANEMEFIVEDNGIGIPDDKIGNIFNRYYQVEALNTQYHGTGIGLAHTRELIELMEGRIDVVSKSGKGTAFIITLPILMEERVKANGKIVEVNAHVIPVNQSLFEAIRSVEVSESAVRLKSARSLPQILVVDDNADVRQYIRTCLQSKFEMTAAAQGKEGLIIARSKLPKLIICDLMMPGMNGLDFCREIKSHLETSHIPVILLTAKANVESQIEGYGMGADDYITKPFTSELLITRIENLIASREKLRNVFKSKIDLNPHEISITSADENFLLNALNIVERHIDEADFGVPELVADLGISKAVVNRKLKALTDLSTAEFIKNTRLKRASQLLREKKHRVADVCYMVGFNDPHYFSKSFRSLFGMSPRQYQETQHVS